jgi:hydroxyethylthiazole kinase-like uncharacterized protein yjeF
MIPVLSTAESSRLDREAADRIDQLMEHAGWALAGAAIELGAGYGSRVSVLTGPGNNGGDGWVAARRLVGRGCLVTVHPLTEPKTDIAGRASRLALEAGVQVAPLGAAAAPDLVIDALFGSGIRDELPPDVLRWIDVGVPIVAAHVPSGLDPDTGTTTGRTFRADVTVAFHALSPGHLLGSGPDLCGRVTVADIGLEGGKPTLEVVTDADAALPARPRTAHKWSAGSVLVVGGSSGMIGAAVMAAKSALRFGAGAVGLAVEPEMSQAAALLAPEVLSYDQTELPDRFDVIVAGPGMGDATDVLKRVLAHDGPLVLDADALMPELPAMLEQRSAPTVLTPHAGELERLTGGGSDWHAARELATSTGTVVLLKGSPTLVCGRGTPRVVTTNGPELASIGTGDVLAGMIGAAIARGMGPAAATAAAAHWHGVAASDLAAERTVTADVLVEHVAQYSGSRGVE